MSVLLGNFCLLAVHSPLLKAIGAAVSSAALVLPFVLFILWLIRHQDHIRANAKEWSSRPAMADEDFLRACLVPRDPMQTEAGLAARRAIASLATVPASTILPDDSFARDLVQLPFWDSLDWLGFVLETEVQSGLRIRLPAGVVERAHEEAGGGDALRVRHVVRAVASAAIPSRHPETRERT
jgi:hypothetical protein